jgi:hypothetical protein
MYSSVSAASSHIEQHVAADLRHRRRIIRGFLADGNGSRADQHGTRGVEGFGFRPGQRTGGIAHLDPALDLHNDFERIALIDDIDFARLDRRRIVQDYCRVAGRTEFGGSRDAGAQRRRQHNGNQQQAHGVAFS